MRTSSVEAGPQEVRTYLLLFGAMVGCGGLLLTGSPALACLPLVLLAAFMVAPSVLRMRPMTAIYGMTGFMLIADGNYPGGWSPTQYLSVAFTQVISSFPSPFELGSGVLGAWVLVKASGRRGDPALQSGQVRAMLAATVPMLLSMAMATVWGAVGGGQLRIAYWQLKAFPFFILWSVFGFLACRSARDWSRFLDVYAAVVALKALNNLVVFAAVYHGTLGKNEYLQSHIGSFYMATAILWLVVRGVYLSRGRQRLWCAAGVALIAPLWVVNDRRVSFLGIAFTAVFSGLFLYPYVTKVHVRRLAVALLLGLAVAGATWNNPGHSVKSLFVKDPNAPVDYRDIENFNLATAVGRSPLTGTGYGMPFEQFMQLPDIIKFSETLAWIPHNSFLMIWANAGPTGLAALGLVLAFSLAAMVRLVSGSEHLATRVCAFVGYGVFVQWTLYIWADMGFVDSVAVLLPGLMSGFAFKTLYLSRPAGGAPQLRRARG